MKKKSLIMILALTFMSTMMFVSCGSKEEENAKWIPSPHFSGKNANLLKCAADSVKVILTKSGDFDASWEVKVMVPLSNTNESRAEHFKEARMGFIEAHLLDVNDSPIDYNLSPEWSKIETLLSADNEMSENVWFADGHRNKYDKAKGIFDKAHGMEMTKMDLTLSRTDENTHSSDSSSEQEFYGDWTGSEDEAYEEIVEPVQSSGKDWDALLNEYEDYVDKYVSFYKKAMNGDMSAMTEYVSLLEKAEKLSSQLETSQNDMSSAQLKRYLKITEKMTNAILEN